MAEPEYVLAQGKSSPARSRALTADVAGHSVRQNKERRTGHAGRLTIWYAHLAAASGR
jgi:hypothetical protein